MVLGKIFFENNFGTKNTQKIPLNPKNLKNQKSKKSDLLNGTTTTRPSHLYARKKNYEKKIIIYEKLSCGLWSEHDMSFSEKA
jgi:hypothetical protein